MLRFVRVILECAVLLGCVLPAAGAQQADSRVAIQTNKGTIVVELFTDRAPVTVQNFLSYVREKHYDGTVFHRVMDGFMIQGGGFDTSMHERSTHPSIKNEANNGLHNVSGTIAMARTSEVNSATAQFFINVADNSFLDHVEVPPGGVSVIRGARQIFVMPRDADQVYGYAVFGRVVEGMDVVFAIQKVQTASSGMYQNVPIDPVVIEKISIIN